MLKGKLNTADPNSVAVCLIACSPKPFILLIETMAVDNIRRMLKGLIDKAGADYKFTLDDLSL